MTTILAACAPETEAGLSSAEVVMSPTICNPSVRVGVALGSFCPTPSSSDWVGDMPTLGTLPGGHMICRYTFVASTPYSSSGLPSESSRPPEDWLDPDCPVVVPLGDDPLAFVHPGARAAYREQMDRADALPYLTSTRGRRAGPSTVRVAIIDSSEDSAPGDDEPTLGAFPHGRAIGMAIREMTCPEGRFSSSSACIPSFKSYLALDLANGAPVAGGTGGYHGYLSTLAERIDDAVDEWQAWRRGPLIINLSLGWHEDYNQYGSYRYSRVRHSGAQAVLAALDRAACAGALIVSAVGNHTGGPDGVDGPMYPAAWASESTWSCGAVPLLHAVGGVDGRDLDLVSARAHARTELVAPALHVAVDNAPTHPDADPPLLPLMSGSSFGAAGVSAAAAIVWGYRPSLSAGQVIDAVYASSVPLASADDPRTADVCNGACDASRRITICGAAHDSILAACGGPVTCPTLAPCRTVPAYAGSNLSSPMPPGATLRPDTVWSSMASPTCSAGTIWGDPTVLGPAPELCPDETFYGVLRFPGAVSSQPGPLGCDVCALVVGEQLRSLFMTINPDWDPSVLLHSPVLYVDGKAFALDSALGGQALEPGDKFLIELPYFADPKNVSLVFAVDGDLLGGEGKYSLQEQIGIWYEN